jgi:hypothetical protein
MSDTKKVNLQTFPIGKEVTITINAETYARLSQFLVEFSISKDVAQLDAMFKHLMSNEPKNRFEYHVATLLFLVSDIETAAKEQGIIELKEVDLADLSSQEKPE